MLAHKQQGLTLRAAVVTLGVIAMMGCAFTAVDGVQDSLEPLAGAVNSLLGGTLPALPKEVPGVPQGLLDMLRDVQSKLPMGAPNNKVTGTANGYCGLQGSPTGQQNSKYRVILEEDATINPQGHQHDHHHHHDGAGSAFRVKRRHADRRMLDQVPNIRQVTIPVYWHLIINETTDSPVNGNIDEEYLLVQIYLLNDWLNGYALWFAGLSGDVAPANFTFQLVSVDRTYNDDWFYVDGATWDEQLDAMTRALHKGGAGALNVYSLYFPRGDPADGSLFATGTASYPWDAAAAGHRDGVFVDVTAVLDFEALGGGNSGIIANSYSLGNSVVHYVGHWLGLFHTFDFVDETCSVQGSHLGDRVADTPMNHFNYTALQECDGLGTFIGGGGVGDFLDYIATLTKDSCPSNGYLFTGVPPQELAALGFANGIPKFVPFWNILSTSSDRCLLISCLINLLMVITSETIEDFQGCGLTATQNQRMYQMYAAYRYNK